MRTRAGGAVALLLSSAVWAQEPAARFSFHVYREASDATVETVDQAMAESFSGDSRLAVHGLSELAQPVTEDAGAALTRADADLEEGEKTFSSMELEQAKGLLAKAIGGYTAHMVALSKRTRGLEPLLEAWVMAAKVRFFDGDDRGVQEALAHCFVLDPKLGFTPKVFPPQMKRVVTDARAALDVQGGGRLTIASTPSGASVYLNGKPLPAPTPTSVEAVAGPNYVTLERKGYRESTSETAVAGSGAQSQLEQKLEVGASAVTEQLEAAKSQLGGAVAPPQLRSAAARLGVDLLALVRLSAAGAASTTITAYLYDARLDRVLKHVGRTSSAEQLSTDSRFVARELLQGVRLDGKLGAPPKQRRSTGAWWGEFRESPYFWPVVGVVAGAVTTGIALGIGFGVANELGVTDDAVDAAVLIGGGDAAGGKFAKAKRR